MVIVIWFYVPFLANLGLMHDNCSSTFLPLMMSRRILQNNIMKVFLQFLKINLNAQMDKRILKYFIGRSLEDVIIIKWNRTERKKNTQVQIIILMV